MKKAIFTIVSNNYLHYARTLFQSVAVHHPECDRYCVVVDRDVAPAARYADEFAVIRIGALALPQSERFLFRYTILELNTAVKPWAIAHLFSLEYDEVVYIDPDIRLYRPMHDVFALLRGEARIVLTPHLLAPTTDDCEPSELAIRVAGTYNLGFCAFARSADASACVAWWQDKLVDGCIVDPARGIFVDQSWMDLVPGLFAGVVVLRHPGYNVAYWNLAQRAVARVEDGWTAAGAPLVFFHFSGFDPGNPARFSKHQNRFTLDRIGDAQALARDYAEALNANGAATLKTLPYGYGVFDDGATRIPDFFRRLYREDPALQSSMGDDPFSRPDMLSTPMPDKRKRGLAVTYGLFALWKSQPGLQDSVALEDAESVARFYEWLLNDGRDAFSDHVVAAHRVLYERGNSQPGAGGIGAIARARFIRQMYFAILGRAPDLDGQRAYERAMAAPLGSLKVCGALLWSAESRARPRWRERALIAVRMFIGHLVDVPASRPAVAGLAPRPLHETHDCRTGTDANGAVATVNVVGYITAESGVGESARSFAKGCRAVGIDCVAIDVGHQNRNRQTDTSFVGAAASSTHPRINVLHVNADQTPATLDVLRRNAWGGDIHIAYWHWEQPVLPPRFLSSFDGLDEVWVPSAFVHEAVATIAPVPVFKVPHVVEFAVPASTDRAKFGLPDDLFLALIMYDFDSYQHRKNPLAAIDAFRRVARTGARIGLVIKTINADRDAAAHRTLAEAIDGLPHVYRIDTYLSRTDVYELQNACDCFVSLHRSEGFGLGLAEMMYLGKPVVATAWSGNMEFMTAMNSFPIEYALAPLSEDLGVYVAGQRWAEADVDHAADALRKLVDDPALRQRIGAAARADMRERYSATAIGEHYAKRLAFVSSRRR